VAFSPTYVRPVETESYTLVLCSCKGKVAEVSGEAVLSTCHRLMRSVHFVLFAAVSAFEALAAPICGGAHCGEQFYGPWVTSRYSFQSWSVGGDEPYSTPDGYVNLTQWRKSDDPFIGGAEAHFFVRGEFLRGTTALPVLSVPVALPGGRVIVIPRVDYDYDPQFPGPESLPQIRIKPKVDPGGVRGKIDQDLSSTPSVAMVEQSPALFMEEIAIPVGTALTVMVITSPTKASADDWLGVYFQGNLLSSVEMGMRSANESFLLPVDLTSFAGQTGYMSMLLHSDDIPGAKLRFVPTLYGVESMSQIDEIGVLFNAPVPEPSSILLLGLGLLTLGFHCRRSRIHEVRHGISICAKSEYRMTRIA
jgi:hypothetical protein